MMIRRDVLQIARLAAISRVLVVAVAIVSDQLIADFDASRTLGHDAESPSAIERYLGGLATWDGVYFRRIAEHGYEFEQYHAFFPLFPLAAGACGRVVHFVLGELISLSDAILVSGLILNNLAFIGAAVSLYLLGCVVLRQDHTAYLAAVVFCFNPASIFFSAFYTESFYAFFSFTGMLALSHDRMAPTVLFFALGAATRSNGLVLVAYTTLRECRRVPWKHWRLLGRFTVRLIVCAAVILLPTLAVQAYGTMRYCDPEDELLKGNPTVWPRPWCDTMFPDIYSFVQKHYWNVDWFAYYTPNNIPNFALALPVLILGFSAALAFKKPHSVADLAFLFGGKVGTINVGLSSWRVFPHWVVLSVLLFVCVTKLHVQVATRFLCAASPLIYWYAATILEDDISEANIDLRRRTRNLPADGLAKLISTVRTHSVSAYLVRWCAVYILLGALLFPNFYPWT